MVWDRCVMHSILAILSQISLFVAGLGSGLYLILKKSNANSASKDFFLKKQYIFNLGCLMFGFILLTAALSIGLMQAENLWGTYWSWDIKQVGTTILWLYYFAILLSVGWMSFLKNKKAAYIASLLTLSGILIMIINIFVLNTFSKLHHFL